MRPACALSHAEHLIVLRYEPGQEYRPHRDYRPPGSIERDRPKPATACARSACTSTRSRPAAKREFPVAGLQVAPRPGRAVIFDNLLRTAAPDLDSLHAGLPVQRGEKWLATLWLRQGRYRDF